jgi:hypothetical protein
MNKYMAEKLELYDYRRKVDRDPIELMMDEEKPCYFCVETDNPQWRGAVMYNIGDLGGEVRGEEDYIIKQKIYVPGKTWKEGMLYYIAPEKKKIFRTIGSASGVRFREKDKITDYYTLVGNPMELVFMLEARGFSMNECGEDF